MNADDPTAAVSSLLFAAVVPPHQRHDDDDGTTPKDSVEPASAAGAPEVAEGDANATTTTTTTTVSDGGHEILVVEEATTGIMRQQLDPQTAAQQHAETTDATSTVLLGSSSLVVQSSDDQEQQQQSPSAPPSFLLRHSLFATEQDDDDNNNNNRVPLSSKPAPNSSHHGMPLTHALFAATTTTDEQQQQQQQQSALQQYGRAAALPSNDLVGTTASSLAVMDLERLTPAVTKTTTTATTATNTNNSSAAPTTSTSTSTTTGTTIPQESTNRYTITTSSSNTFSTCNRDEDEPRASSPPLVVPQQQPYNNEDKNRCWRRQRRRRTCELLQRSRGSFTALLYADYNPENEEEEVVDGSKNEKDSGSNPPPDDAPHPHHHRISSGGVGGWKRLLLPDDDDAPEEVVSPPPVVLSLEQLPKRIRIDLDAELGLLPPANHRPRVTFVQQRIVGGGDNDDDYDDASGENNTTTVIPYRQVLPDGTLSSWDAPNTTTNHPTTTSSSCGAGGAGMGGLDSWYSGAGVSERHHPFHEEEPHVIREGWYEGVVAVHLPEDGQYLNPVQAWIRTQLEFFSTTDQDLRRGGRVLYKKVRGQVGVRCRHCAAAAATATRPWTWPVGSVAYPANLQSIYLVCSQKIGHLETCPYLPEREQLQLLSMRQRGESDAAASRKKSVLGISSVVYCLIGAKRIGLVESKLGGSGSGALGLFFARDFTLDPLPWETVRLQVQAEAQQLPHMTASSGGSSGGGMMETSVSNVLDEPRIVAAEPEAEAVLAETISQWDDYPTNGALTTSDDKSLVTDYVFLLVRQLAICWLGPLDLMHRRLKVLGYAGFCCRWCRSDDEAAASESSGMGDVFNPAATSAKCRSFPNSPDSMKSNVLVSVANHLQKCPDVPPRIKMALIAYKKIHARQMAQLQLGGQKKLYELLFVRLRDSDRLGREEERDGVGGALSPAQLVRAECTELPSPASNPRSTRESRLEAKEQASIELENEPSATNFERPASFPACTDPETLEIIAKSLADWDPVENDFLLLPNDRVLISDYVFLAMRQLRIIHPNKLDHQRIRHSIQIPGIACLHCMDSGKFVDMSPSGRSFSSAPDNFSSALNASLYNHMQGCPFVPLELKRALAVTRKLHSAQCSSLRFGSQRRFFNLLYQRLERAKKEKHPDGSDVEDGVSYENAMQVEDVAPSESASETINMDADVPKEFLVEHGFFRVLSSHGPDSVSYCHHCLMVPIQFRAPGSIFFQPVPPTDLITKHSSQCRKSHLDLGMLVEILQQFVQRNPVQHVRLMTAENRGNFKLWIDAAVGRDSQLTQAFGDHVWELLQRDIGEDATTSPTTIGKTLPSIDIRDMHFPPIHVDFALVEQAFGSWMATVPGVSVSLSHHPDLMQFLQLISPHFLALPASRGETETIALERDPQCNAERIKDSENQNMVVATEATAIECNPRLSEEVEKIEDCAESQAIDNDNNVERPCNIQETPSEQVEGDGQAGCGDT